MEQNYRLKRSTLRRTLALSVGAQGLVVYAPWALPACRVEKFVLEHAAWVTQKLAGQADYALPRLGWQDGVRLRLLGETVTLRLREDVSSIAINGGVLYFPVLPVNSIQSTVIAWYQRTALSYFHERLTRFSALLTRQPAALKLSGAGSRWGSCTKTGVIRVNWRLLQASRAEADYVLAHELAHLTHMNHSPAFWREVSRLYPGYDEARALLRRQGHHYMQISL
ncbi:MAG TPA: SprT family zinc-dependent metalloprotease [Burkholderiales bacterium]|nr:SprT family zinc-dependent metalloprotease [Burkholderiales bacterium]